MDTANSNLDYMAHHAEPASNPRVKTTAVNDHGSKSMFHPVRKSKPSTQTALAQAANAAPGFLLGFL